MNIGMLLKGEVMKGSRRLAARVTLWSYLGVLILAFGTATYQERRHLETVTVVFPRIWAQLLQPFGGISVFLVALVIIMLTASEFMWRTARQNVIDGLSKDEWFVAKLLNVLLVCVVFAMVLFGTGAAFAIAHPFTTIMRAADAKMLGAYMLGLFGVGSFAFLMSMLFRRDGAALGVLLIWASLGESLVGVILEKWHKGWGEYGRYLPFRVFLGIFEPARWDPVILQRRAEMAARMHRPVAQQADMRLLLVIAASYIVLLTAAAYVNYRQRDL